MCPATADIAAHVFANLLRRGGVTLIYACYRSHDMARRAIAALERIMINEGLLHWMDFAFRWRQAFNRRHLAPVRVTAGVRHETTRLPSKCTVQAPHWP
jgi:hypothetical protein